MGTTAPTQHQPVEVPPPAGLPAGVAPQLDDPATVETLRGQIDALDTAIVRLVGERAQLSRRIQTARMNAGGTRVELGRERTIVDRYRTRLGGGGSGLAEAVLRVCRGAR